MRHTSTRRVTALAVALAAAGGLSWGGVALASPTGPAAGEIHVYVVNTSTSEDTPNTVLITGAFSDHGTASQNLLTLAKGTITVNLDMLNAITNAESFGHFNQASCSFWGMATAVPIPVVRGTGAYAGITGSLTGTVNFAAQGSLTASGQCNQDQNAPAVAQVVLAVVAGKVSF